MFCHLSDPDAARRRKIRESDRHPIFDTFQNRFPIFLAYRRREMNSGSLIVVELQSQTSGHETRTNVLLEITVNF